MNRLLTIDETKRYLRVKKSTIYSWANKGKIPAIKIGKFWRFKKEDIDKWLEEKRNGQSQVQLK